LNRQVDIVTVDMLKERIRDRILLEAVKLWEENLQIMLANNPAKSYTRLSVQELEPWDKKPGFSA
jgi:hypothetical protein